MSTVTSIVKSRIIGTYFIPIDLIFQKQYVLGFTFRQDTMADKLQEILGCETAIPPDDPRVFQFMRFLVTKFYRPSYLYVGIGMNPDSESETKYMVLVLDKGSRKALQRRMGEWQRRFDEAKKRVEEEDRVKKEAQQMGENNSELV